MSELDDLIAKGLIEAVESDLPMAEQWISDARRHLEAAQAIQTMDPSGAYVLAYDAARKAVAAALLMTGHRFAQSAGVPSGARSICQSPHQGDRRTRSRAVRPPSPREEPI